jgi:hypothetical protein
MLPRIIKYRHDYTSVTAASAMHMAVCPGRNETDKKLD